MNGLRLAGIEGTVARSEADLRNALEMAAQQPDIAVLLVTEKIAETYTATLDSARAAGVDFVKPNDIHTVTLDRMMSNDGTTHLTVDMYHNQLKNPKIADKDKVVFIMDHNVPAENPKTAEAHKKMRDFAIENDIKLYEGQGLSLIHI
mgnify:CR=1 FL=1